MTASGHWPDQAESRTILQRLYSPTAFFWTRQGLARLDANGAVYVYHRSRIAHDRWRPHNPKVSDLPGWRVSREAAEEYIANGTEPRPCQEVPWRLGRAPRKRTRGCQR